MSLFSFPHPSAHSHFETLLSTHLHLIFLLHLPSLNFLPHFSSYFFPKLLLSPQFCTLLQFEKPHSTSLTFNPLIIPSIIEHSSLPNSSHHWTSLFPLSLKLIALKNPSLLLLSIVPSLGACEVLVVVPLPLSCHGSVVCHCEVLLSIEIVSLFPSLSLSLSLLLFIYFFMFENIGLGDNTSLFLSFHFLGLLGKKTQRLLITGNILKC